VGREGLRDVPEVAAPDPLSYPPGRVPEKLTTRESLRRAFTSWRTGAVTLLSFPSGLPLGIVLYTVPYWMQQEGIDIKTIGLVVILIYAFFKFAWAYRLFNYVAILLGAMPPASAAGTPEAETHVKRTAGLLESAGRNFNRGQRAFFFALGYLGWFAGPYVLMAATVATVLVMWRRQFASESRRALVEE